MYRLIEVDTIYWTANAEHNVKLLTMISIEYIDSTQTVSSVFSFSPNLTLILLNTYKQELQHTNAWKFWYKLNAILYTQNTIQNSLFDWLQVIWQYIATSNVQNSTENSIANSTIQKLYNTNDL